MCYSYITLVTSFSLNGLISGSIIATYLFNVVVSSSSVKGGIFRQYAGPRALEDFQEYIDLKKWNDTEPVPSWKAPDSFLYVQFMYIKISFELNDGFT